MKDLSPAVPTIQYVVAPVSSRCACGSRHERKTYRKRALVSWLVVQVESVGLIL
jgi:hypothetical protein